jgi:hypothetical protein
VWTNTTYVVAKPMEMKLLALDRGIKKVC